MKVKFLFFFGFLSSLVFAADTHGVRPSPAPGREEAPDTTAMELLLVQAKAAGRIGIRDVLGEICQGQNNVNLTWKEYQRRLSLLPSNAAGKQEAEDMELLFSQSLGRLEVTPDALALAKTQINVADLQLEALTNSKPAKQVPAIAEGYADIWRYEWRIAVLKAEQADREYRLARIKFKRYKDLEDQKIGAVSKELVEKVETEADNARRVLCDDRKKAFDLHQNWKAFEKRAKVLESRYNLDQPTLDQVESDKDAKFEDISKKWPTDPPKITEKPKPRLQDDGVESRMTKLLEKTTALANETQIEEMK